METDTPQIPSPGQVPPGSIPLEMIAVGLGMDPNTSNSLQKPDENFLKEIIKVPLDISSMPSGTDVLGMRKWINETFLSSDLNKYREDFEIELQNPRQEINADIINVKCSDGQGEFALWVYEPTTSGTSDKSRPAILMMHGGGWIHGNPLGDEVYARIFASELDAVVFGIDYRLAPEHPFPAPLDDCNDALDWVIQHAAKYRIDTGRIAIWGASAGANLAAALALRISDGLASTAKPPVCFASLVVPVAAHPAAFVEFEGKRKFPKSDNEALFSDNSPPPDAIVQEFEKLYELYTGGTTSVLDPLVSPLMANPSSRHPRTHITVAACDHLRAQGQAYAELLRQSGVQVTEGILPGVPHGFTLPTKAIIGIAWLSNEIKRFAEAFGA